MSLVLFQIFYQILIPYYKRRERRAWRPCSVCFPQLPGTLSIDGLLNKADQSAVQNYSRSKSKFQIRKATPDPHPSQTTGTCSLVHTQGPKTWGDFSINNFAFNLFLVCHQ